MKKSKTPVSSLKHSSTRSNIPTEETKRFMTKEQAEAKPVLYPRDPSLDPQLVWRGKAEQDSQPLEVPSVPVYIQEKIHPQALVEELRAWAAKERSEEQAQLFNDFNGLTLEQQVEFYRHSNHWSNRMILGDSLLTMTSLAEREGLKGKVQMIYLDPPYGIKFGSNWQVSTRKRDVKDTGFDNVTRQPEQIKAFRDTWELGIHSYLSYLRDRLVVARELLTESGSLFVQIGDENVHLVRCLMDEVMGSENFVSIITYATTAGRQGDFVDAVGDYVVWYSKNRDVAKNKYRQLFDEKIAGEGKGGKYSLQDEHGETFTIGDITSQEVSDSGVYEFNYQGEMYLPGRGRHWSCRIEGLNRIAMATRLVPTGQRLMYRRFLSDFPVTPLPNLWTDTSSGASTLDPKVYVVQTRNLIIERCLLMTTDPGDLVLDPTCGSGTTAYVAEQWGRRWITIDTSRVALALARTRLMAGKYPFFLLADSEEGRRKELELGGRASARPESDAEVVLGQASVRSESDAEVVLGQASVRSESDAEVVLGQASVRSESDPDVELGRAEARPPRALGNGDVRKGFVWKRVPHVTLKSIANNDEIDAIHARWQVKLEPLRTEINRLAGKNWEEWEIPRPSDDQSKIQNLKSKISEWWDLRRKRQQEIDVSIARHADTETLYDQPYEDKKRVRVAGPFTVESLSPHRYLGLEGKRQFEESLKPFKYRIAGSDDIVEEPDQGFSLRGPGEFETIILDNLRKAGVQNTFKGERLKFDTLDAYPGQYLHGSGEITEKKGTVRKVAVCVGPEYGTVSPELIREAAKEAVKGVGFDILLVNGFNFDGMAQEETKHYGKLTVLLSKMAPELGMGDELLKKTGAGNLFMIVGEPDIVIRRTSEGKVEVEVRGMDVYDPTTGQVRSSSPDEIACWFIDTDYNEESFFVRHAYFTGADKPYERLSKTLKADLDESAWQSLYRTVSRPFDPPKKGKIAVKVINHFGDEVLKVYEVNR